MAGTNYEHKKAAIKRYLDSKERITVWMKPEEKEEIRQKANDKKMSMSDYIRERLFGTKGATKEE